MFAQRLLRSILPKWLTRRLEKLHPELLEPPIPPTSPEVPPTITVTPTPTIEPTPGVIAEPTPGVDAEPTPITPEAITPTPVFGIGVDIPDPPTGGSIAPLYVSVFSGGPFRIGPRGLKRKLKTWFNEQFDDLTTNSWSKNEISGGTATIEDGSLRLYAPTPIGIAGIFRTGSGQVPPTFEVNIKNKVATTSDQWYFFIGNTAYMISLSFYEVWDVGQIWNGSNWFEFNIGEIGDQDILWKITVDGSVMNMWKADEQVLTDFTLPATTQPDGRMKFEVDNPSTSYTDYFIIKELVV
ncbi:MAG: hypothetical protein IMF10_04255 [Proteobacteria bacterium]|nr:hypothetical protein [Pseudomonadota bacterium]